MHLQPGSWPVRRIAWWALAAVAAVAWQGRGLLHDLRSSPDVVVDFYQEWASARNFLNGLPIYEPQRISCLRYLGCTPVAEMHFFLEVNAHPPPTVLLGLPLAVIAYPTAVLVWNLVSLAALAASVWLVARQLGYRASGWAVLPAIVFIMLCWPLRSHLQQGQLAMVLLLLIAGAWAAERSGWEKLAGTLVGAAAVMKLFPALLFLHFAFRRQWRAVAAGAACIVVLTGATVAVLGPVTYSTYLRDVPSVIAEWRSHWNNASLPGLWSKLFDPGTKGSGVVPLVYNPTIARLLILASCGAVVIFVARTAQGAQTRDECDRSFAAAVAGMLLVTPVTWEHGFLLLMVPFAVSWATAPAGSFQRRILVLLVALLMLMNPATLYKLWILGDTRAEARAFCSAPQVLMILSVQCYALLAIFLIALKRGEVAQPAPVILSIERAEKKAA
jgi:hypothetical protein